MSVRHLFTSLLVGLGPAAPAVVNALAQPDPTVYGWTTGRVWASAAALVGLAGAVIGGLALARSAGRVGTGTGRRGAVVALAAGLAGTIVGGVVVAVADGGPGAGYGIVGGYVALVVGPIAVLLGGLALNRSRRSHRVG
ncbi:DUF6223 family protein [Nonomuraea jiangxiensis]|uniref:Major facilitator superfamily (MFS) profile domain-containing protein n=1 Tax=Nonomuraea jiangxiensis TaxID=633440 RepID=A0A1G9ULE6_9ACTN|nr:DUF6223 family protein [Nonomuraea jiangxiensis]SDM60728.1 hypothetical protein SAMN05421869_14911 [Nonomuraea jiangxiensis]